MKRIYYNQSDLEGQGFWRCQLPVKHCKGPLAQEGVELTLDTGLDGLDYDVFVFHRLLKPYFLPVVEQIKKLGEKLVWELDDDLWHVPSWNPASKSLDATALGTVDWLRETADAILVSTPELAKVVNRPDKTWIAPNLVDLEGWPAPSCREDDGEVRVLWAGGLNHEKDLDEIVPAVDRLLAEFPQVSFYFFGDLPVPMAEYVRIRYSHLGLMVPRECYGGRVGFIQPVPTDQYVETLCDIQPDIAVCPLCDHPFNNSKSNIKWMEMTLAGAAVVATDLPPYQCIDDGGDGLLVQPGDAEGWYENLKLLIEEAEFRRLLAATARLRVEREFSWQGPAKQIWLEAFRRMV